MTELPAPRSGELDLAGPRYTYCTPSEALRGLYPLTVFAGCRIRR